MSPDDDAPHVRDRDSEALLTAMDSVEVSQEERQNGYDISLLALKPRNSAHLPNSLAVEHEDPFVDADERSPLAHPDSSFAASDRPSSTRSSEQRTRLTAVPPVSNTVPRFAAAAYQHRAQASESRSSLTKHRLETMLAGEAHEADEEKGSWVVDGVKTRVKKPLWQRRWLLLVAAVVVLSVSVGVGAGVGVMMSRKNHSTAADKQDTASTSASSSFTAVPHTAIPLPASSSPSSSPPGSAGLPATAAPTDSGSAGETAWDSSPTLAPQGASPSAAATEWVPTSDAWSGDETGSGWT